MKNHVDGNDIDYSCDHPYVVLFIITDRHGLRHYYKMGPSSHFGNKIVTIIVRDGSFTPDSYLNHIPPKSTLNFVNIVKRLVEKNEFKFWNETCTQFTVHLA